MTVLEVDIAEASRLLNQLKVSIKNSTEIKAVEIALEEYNSDAVLEGLNKKLENTYHSTGIHPSSSGSKIYEYHDILTEKDPVQNRLR